MAEKAKKTAKKAEAAAPAAPEPKAPAKKAKQAGPVAGPHASLHFLRLAPRKVRLVADHVRGLQVGPALALLKYTPNAAAGRVGGRLRAAVADGGQGGGRVDVEGRGVEARTGGGGGGGRGLMP